MKIMRYIFFVTIVVMMMSVATFGQVSITTNSYSQDFNTLALTGTTNSTLPSGWSLSESGTGANTTYSAGTGSGNAGDTYSFGLASNSDRAFGGLISGTVTPTIGAGFTNNTGGTVSSLDITYTGEQWRLGALGRVDSLGFQISFDATSLTSGTWTSVAGLKFIAPVTTGTVGALDGNLIANKVTVSSTIASISVVNGSTFWVRWLDFNATSSDDGLAVDDFSMTNNSPLPVELTSFNAIVKGKNIELQWNTATEVNNYGFEVEKNVSGSWNKIGFVEGNGTTNAPKSYNYVDASASGKVTYRLKQIDRDGKFEYSSVVEATVAAIKTFGLDQNYPNPFNPATVINYQLPMNSLVTLKVYDALGREVATLVNETKEAGTYSATFNGSKLSCGIYFYTLRAGNFIATKKLTMMK